MRCSPRGLPPGPRRAVTPRASPAAPTAPVPRCGSLLFQPATRPPPPKKRMIKIKNKNHHHHHSPHPTTAPPANTHPPHSHPPIPRSAPSPPRRQPGWCTRRCSLPRRTQSTTTGCSRSACAWVSHGWAPCPRQGKGRGHAGAPSPPASACWGAPGPRPEHEGVPPPLAHCVASQHLHSNTPGRSAPDLSPPELNPSPTPAAEAWVGSGSHLKRISMHGRGRSGRRLRYRSHLTVSLLWRGVWRGFAR